MPHIWEVSTIYHSSGAGGHTGPFSTFVPGRCIQKAKFKHNVTARKPSSPFSLQNRRMFCRKQNFYTDYYISRVNISSFFILQLINFLALVSKCIFFPSMVFPLREGEKSMRKDKVQNWELFSTWSPKIVRWCRGSLTLHHQGEFVFMKLRFSQSSLFPHLDCFHTRPPIHLPHFVWKKKEHIINRLFNSEYICELLWGRR